MKKWLSPVLALLLLLGLASCAKNKNYFNFKYDEYVTLGEYRGVAVDVHALEDAVESAKQSIITENTTTQDVTERGAAEEDTATVSYTVSIEGTPVEALAKTDYAVTLGTTKTDLPLAGVITGMKVDEEKTQTITLPENLKIDGQDSEYAGKQAELTLTVTKLTEKIVPQQITDEMVSAYTDGTYTTAQAYYDAVRADKKETLAFSAAMEQVKILKYPQEESKLYYNMYLSQLSSSISSSGMTLESYASMLGYDSLEAFLSEYVTPMAASAAMQQVVALSIYEKEGLSYTDAEYAEMADRYATQNSMENGDAYIEEYGDTDIVLQLKSNAVYAFLAENAVETDEHDHTEDTTAQEDQTQGEPAETAA